MKTTFADSFFYLALLSEDDEAHASAVQRSQTLTGNVVTTDWVLTEVADAMAMPGRRENFSRLLDDLSSDPEVSIVPASRDLFESGISLYRSRPDKQWSLTDCISFVVMKDRGIKEALTGDRHFEQAGFTALL